jgi:hypothetical protein
MTSSISRWVARLFGERYDSGRCGAVTRRCLPGEVSRRGEPSHQGATGPAGGGVRGSGPAAGPAQRPRCGWRRRACPGRGSRVPMASESAGVDSDRPTRHAPVRSAFPRDRRASSEENVVPPLGRRDQTVEVEEQAFVIRALIPHRDLQCCTAVRAGCLDPPILVQGGADAECVSGAVAVPPPPGSLDPVGGWDAGERVRHPDVSGHWAENEACSACSAWSRS